ncbi:hypothetical protein RJ55_00759 [Drechmeria coniospora]|nr:hypothetical protein RJ55_00759 [Drechmeria coniospora]
MPSTLLATFKAALALTATATIGYASTIRPPPGTFPAARGFGLERRAPGVSGKPWIRSFNLSVPIDHFHNDSCYEPHSDGHFNLRYWLDASNYKEGGPVIVLHSGEFNSQDRLAYLDYGIVSILTKATGGVGLILEHRYYGTSFPTANLTFENLRFLTTEQALADTAYFAKHVQFYGLEHHNLTAPNAPWILYGGSYAGSVAAFARKLYPDIFWGAISSSGPLQAIDNFWQFFEVSRRYAPADCSVTQQKLVHVIDTMLFSNDSRDATRIKKVFGLEYLWDDEFAGLLSATWGRFQNTNWDPKLNDTSFNAYCTTITSNSLLFQNATSLRSEVERAVILAGYKGEAELLSTQMLNWIGYTRKKMERLGEWCRKKDLRECISGRFDQPNTRLDAGFMRTWGYQTCTEWGLFQSGEGFPEDVLPVVSRAYTYEYAAMNCRRQFNMTTRPNVQAINKLGGFQFSFPRVAIIDGTHDEWRAATPHAFGQRDRNSTTTEPFILIDGAAHHWDENGLKEEDEGKAGLLPEAVAKTQAMEVEFVKAWLREFDSVKSGKVVEG